VGSEGRDGKEMIRIWKEDVPLQRLLNWLAHLWRAPANPVRCPRCGVLHGNHGINCPVP